MLRDRAVFISIDHADKTKDKENIIEIVFCPVVRQALKLKRAYNLLNQVTLKVCGQSGLLDVYSRRFKHGIPDVNIVIACRNSVISVKQRDHLLMILCFFLFFISVIAANMSGSIPVVGVVPGGKSG